MLCASVCVVLLGSPAAWAVSPYHSIVPEKPRSTPYGLQIVESGDVLTGRESGDSAAPQVAPTPLTDSAFHAMVEQFESQGGPYDPRLTEPLHTMGRAFIEKGEPFEAMKVFRRAMQVSRINEGLNGPAQLPILDDMVELRLLLGQFEEADQLVSRRFRLQQAVYAPGDENMMQATREYLDWQRQAYLQGVGGSSYLRLLDMHDVYSANIERLSQSNGADEEIIAQHYDRMLVEYLISRYDGERQSMLRIQLSGPADADPLLNGQLEGERFRQLQKNNFRNGRRSLEAIIEAATRAEGPESDAVGKAYVALGDWYMWWQEESRALQQYEKAWAIFSASGALASAEEAFFTRPVELPDTRVFLSDGSVPTENVKARAKVMLTVSRYGEAREIEILEQEPPEDVGARVVLFRLLRDVRFRPVMKDGKTVSWSGLERDYRYQY
ncbi:hypothetical protein C0039_01350 [Pseudohalioglobus lutimaris]|uniref:Tetratricopeptide repeat protein n=2 Tax=Pseudohalioglobus lutimaris TaxID=1737061 RepID=A0A2N5X8K5_9GAMM|nr:hypothetical protein C0039_01350 [Pseudohalioglobus lutimaris]